MFFIIFFIFLILVAPVNLFASPGGPDRDQHPYVGMVVIDLGDGQISPNGHITLISSTEAIIANHQAQSGQDITFTLDNPVILPATLHTGTVRLGGFDFDDYEVDVAIVDLHTPVELPRYAQLPDGLISHGPGDILDYVTYIGMNRAAIFSCGLPSILQREPAHVEFDRNLMQTTTAQGRENPSRPQINDPTKQIATMNLTCYGNSGSPIFLKGTDIVAGVLSWGGYRCLGGGDSIFARTDNELALGILTGTVPPPPPPTTYPPFIEGSGVSGSTSFSATIVAGAEYTADVKGLTPATESGGRVAEGDFAIFPVSVTPGFRFFIAETFDDFTSGNDDLDLYLIWENNDGQQYLLFLSEDWYTSDEMVVFSGSTLEYWASSIPLDDPYNFEIWVSGFDTEGEYSDFTLFTWESEDIDEGNMTVSSVTADPEDPVVEIGVNWFGLDSGEKKYFGIIDHNIDGVLEPEDKSTLVQIHIAP